MMGFQGAKITSDVVFLLLREIDERFGIIGQYREEPDQDGEYELDDSYVFFHIHLCSFGEVIVARDSLKYFFGNVLRSPQVS
jgi:hypothetical protein